MGLNWKRKKGREALITRQENGVPYLAFGALEKTGLVKHGFSTRLGGVSEGEFASMNLSYTVGDSRENVRQNYERIAASLGVKTESMAAPYQAHTVNIRRVTEADRGKGITREKDQQPIDGFITDTPDVTLVSLHADCIPLYIVDPVHRAIGLSHSGWKGTAHRIGSCTLKEMNEAFGTESEDVIACIGPGICMDCYEVGEDVAEEFRQSFDKSRHAEILRSKGGGKYQLDLWRTNEIIFLEAGVKHENIHVTDICTHCNTDYLFSHRVMGEKRGSLAAFLALRS